MMSVTSLQELGLGPLESQPGEVPYTEYWNEAFLPAITRVRPQPETTLERIGRSGRFIAEVTEKVIRNRDLEALGEHRGIIGGPGCRSLTGVLVAWDKAMGGLNGMVDGKDDLLTAASMMLEENVDPALGEWTEGPDTRTPYKSFISQWNRNDLSVQRPNAVLLRTAELVHKAAWVDQDTQRQDRLLGVALDIYRRTLDTGSLKPHEVWQAEDKISDIEFHVQSALARKAKKNLDVETYDVALERMQQLVQRDAGVLLQRYLDLPPEKGKAGGPIGILFEGSNTLAGRKKIIAKDMPEIEIRRSFDSENRSHDILDCMLPMTKSDLIVQRYGEGYIATTPAQLKLQSSKNGNPSKAEDYFPGIVFVEGVDIHQSTLMRAAIDMAKGNYTSAVSKTLEPFSRLEAELGMAG